MESITHPRSGEAQINFYQILMRQGFEVEMEEQNKIRNGHHSMSEFRYISKNFRLITNQRINSL